MLVPHTQRPHSGQFLVEIRSFAFSFLSARHVQASCDLRTGLLGPGQAKGGTCGESPDITASGSGSFAMFLLIHLLLV